MANKGKMSAAGFAPGGGINGKVSANMGKRYMAAIGKPAASAVLHHQVTCAGGVPSVKSKGPGSWYVNGNGGRVSGPATGQAFMKPVNYKNHAK